jgi:protein-tyrosine phosphatase
VVDGGAVRFAACNCFRARHMNVATLGAKVRLKGAYDAARHLPDRVLHRRRHLAVGHRLSRLPRSRSILVICHGNICRSPYFAALVKRRLPDVKVASAGFVAPAGRSVPPFSLTVSSERGIDLSTFRSQTVAPAHVRGADLFVVMEKGQARFLSLRFGIEPERIIVAGDLDPMPASSRDIMDPWQGSIEAFEASFDRLGRCADTLIDLLLRQSSESAESTESVSQ